MQMVFDVFNDRIGEMEIYFKSIEQLYETENSFENNYEFHSDQFLKMLKANAIIMVYNLVESSIMGGILEIYDQLKSSGHTYNDVRMEIQKIWFSYKFNEVYDKNAHYNSYRDKAYEIISGILKEDVIVLNRKATDISGNLDAEKVRQLCKEHGIKYELKSNCRGGAVLSEVKEKRNNLAHGTISFVECGRDYSVEELISIKDETIIFLECILNGMKEYYDNKWYLNRSSICNSRIT